MLRRVVGLVLAVAGITAAADIPRVEQVRVEAPEVALSLDDHVKTDFPQMPDSGICRYAVPAMGETQYLPKAYPYDGVPNGACAIIAAKDEYEPGSFVLYSTKDYGKLEFEVSDLKQVEKVGGGGDNGGERETDVIFSKEDLDLRVVKVWYQNGNGWYSYFQDFGKKLCPELLLHDEDLVRVDTEGRDNYARLVEKDGRTGEYWITAPQKVYTRTPGFDSYWTPQAFLCMMENFSDAPEFCGATLKKGECKQFILTAHVRKNTKAGLYRGEIRVKAKDQGRRWIDSIPVVLKVHDFVLPQPKTYFNTQQDYLTYFCEYVSLDKVMLLNGGNMALAERQLKEIRKNFARHGYYASCLESAEMRKWLETEGISFRHGHGCTMKPGEMADMRFDVREAVRRCDREFGFHKGLVASYGDEYGLAVLRSIRPMVELYQDAGFVFSVNSRRGYSAGLNVADLWWPPVEPAQKSAKTAAKFNACGGERWMGWYASHHVGPESPAFNRRQYGFGPYRAGLSCNYNYAHHLDGWNDIATDGYKPMMLVYGSGDGCIDTLAWEGFREGLDDIRYATLLKSLAEKLAADERAAARYASRLALKLLADADGDDEDLQTLRLEMIEWIERLLKVRGEVEGRG